MSVKFKPSKAYPEQINVKVTMSTKERHDLLSRKLRVDVSDYIRKAIDDVLKDLENKVKATDLAS